MGNPWPSVTALPKIEIHGTIKNKNSISCVILCATKFDFSVCIHMFDLSLIFHIILITFMRNLFSLKFALHSSQCGTRRITAG